MKTLHWIAGIALALEMPVPVYWLVLHLPVNFWRRHVRAAYFTAVAVAWGGGDWLLYHFRSQLFPARSAGAPSLGIILVGLALIGADAFILTRVEFALGKHRLVGHAELKGTGDLATTGLYARIRHPRYLGMMATVLGCCLLAGSLHLWGAAAAWWLVALGTIRLEERELRRRFGAAYAEYAKRVPALLPLRMRPRQS
jgi:protein-S-isoprenylcysteine O-methyltransferase Ste14